MNDRRRSNASLAMQQCLTACRGGVPICLPPRTAKSVLHCCTPALDCRRRYRLPRHAVCRLSSTGHATWKESPRMRQFSSPVTTVMKCLHNSAAPLPRVISRGEVNPEDKSRRVESEQDRHWEHNGNPCGHRRKPQIESRLLHNIATHTFAQGRAFK